MTWRNIRRAAWIALFTTAVALAGAKINLFGLESSSGDRADDVAQRLGIVSYRHAGHDAPRRGQDRVRVIHIDDESLAALRHDWGGWPPGYENLALMIEDVATAPRIEPARGVFVDLEITGENLTPETAAEFDGLIATLGRLTGAGTAEEPGWGAVEGCRSDPLTTLACMVEWEGVPIILASGEATAATGWGPARERLAEVALLSPTLIDSRNYPLARVRLPPGASNEPRSSDDYVIYPAAAMYAVNCLVSAQKIGHDVCRVPAVETARLAAAALKANPRAQPARPDWGEVRESWEKPEAVIWSSDASPRQKTLWSQTSQAGSTPQCVTNPSLWQRLSARGPAEGDKQACVYTLSLGYDRLVAGLGLSRDRDYPDLLGDKLILIGVQFRSSDWTPTPLHGALPGVQYHAMALDNLLEFGRDYRRNEGPGLGRGDVFSAILTFLLLFAVNLASIEKQRIMGVRGAFGPVKAIAWYGGLAAIIVVGLTLYLLITGFVWRSVMVNWIGILATVFAALWFTARNDISGDLADWLNRSRAGKTIVTAVTTFNDSLRPVPPTPPEDKS